MDAYRVFATGFKQTDLAGTGFPERELLKHGHKQLPDKQKLC
jgi:hypothetical protein